MLHVGMAETRRVWRRMLRRLEVLVGEDMVAGWRVGVHGSMLETVTEKE